MYTATENPCMVQKDILTIGTLCTIQVETRQPTIDGLNESEKAGEGKLNLDIHLFAELPEF